MGVWGKLPFSPIPLLSSPSPKSIIKKDDLTITQVVLFGYFNKMGVELL